MKYRILLLLLLVTSCSKHPSLPTSFTEVNETPHIFPDYVDVVVPPNIAPLNFLVDDVEDVDDLEDYEELEDFEYEQ